MRVYERTILFSWVCPLACSIGGMAHREEALRDLKGGSAKPGGKVYVGRLPWGGRRVLAYELCNHIA